MKKKNSKIIIKQMVNKLYNDEEIKNCDFKKLNEYKD